MTSTTARLTILLLVAGLCLAAALAAGTPAPPVEPKSARTVWLDTGPFGQKKKAAKRLSELHAEQATEGYRLVDVEPYVENGDLEGFWVSYVPDS